MWMVLTGFALFAIGYLCLFRPYLYWIWKGVKQGSPVPIFGDSWRLMLRKQTFGEMIQMIYNACPNRYFGLYHFTKPALLLKDPDLIKQITVKDFDHFSDHFTFLPEEIDPLWGNGLFARTGQKWRDMRSTLSPAFTSSKVKQMFVLIAQTGDQFMKHFLKQDEDVIAIQVKDTFSRFTNDVIANTIFGVECDSLEDRKNEFYLMGKKVTDLASISRGIKMILSLLVPQISKVIDVKLFSTEVATFFSKIIKENIASREAQGIVRPDMINLLMEARKNGLKHEENQSIQDAGFATAEESEIGKNSKRPKALVTELDITAQTLVFFFAGFETISSLMCFVGYELAVNPDIQQKLIQEIDDTREAHNGKLTYESLLSMKYMDMVVSETLRMWPIQVVTDRVCTKPYTIEPTTADENPVFLDKDESVWIPIYALQRDPQYYPDPDRFDPERFSDENKSNIKPYTYLPFGSGPRNCIGSRFAILETKALFFHILTSFEIIPIEKTEIPIKISKKSFNLSSESDVWVGLKRRAKI